MQGKLLLLLQFRGRPWAVVEPVSSVTHLHLTEARRGELTEVSEVMAVEGQGLEGDRYLGTIRNVTVVSRGEPDAAAAELGYPIPPGATRRNITVDTQSLPPHHRGHHPDGRCDLGVWRDCAPCSRMYQTVGPGAREALAGRVGISARVVEGGMIRVGDRLDIEPS